VRRVSKTASGDRPSKLEDEKLRSQDPLGPEPQGAEG
jgi:hypothetical protein